MQTQGLKNRATAVVTFLGVALVVLLSLTGEGRAQVAGATLTGTITDKSGAVVPNVQISVTNTATGVTTKATTDSAGLYTAPNLVPGSYEVTMQAQGFKTEKRTGLTFTVGEQVVINESLGVGSAGETVNVTGEAPSIDLTSAPCAQK